MPYFSVTNLCWARTYQVVRARQRYFVSQILETKE